MPKGNTGTPRDCCKYGPNKGKASSAKPLQHMAAPGVGAVALPPMTTGDVPRDLNRKASHINIMNSWSKGMHPQHWSRMTQKWKKPIQSLSM
mmetsp:Transcript_99489/g.276795  ORF Transcript_99489/g.276795 Transcript_99489/m.276795 type:complete len:92 (-) Transcript_99489:161-436(-)